MKRWIDEYWPEVGVVVCLFLIVAAYLSGCGGSTVHIPVPPVESDRPAVVATRTTILEATAPPTLARVASPAVDLAIVVDACYHLWPEVLYVAGHPDQYGAEYDAVAAACQGEAWASFQVFLALFGWTPPATAGPIDPRTELHYVGHFLLDIPGLAFSQLENGIGIAVEPGSGEMVVNANGFSVVDIPAPVASKDWRAMPRATLKRTLPVQGSTVRGSLDMPDNHRVGALGWIDGMIWGGSFRFYNTSGGDYLGLWAVPDPAVDGVAGGFRAGPAGVTITGHNGGPLRDAFHGNKTHGGWLSQIPPGFADAHLGGRTAATGRHREAGAFGGAQGPSLYAFFPDVNAAPGSDLSAIPLMLYPTNSGTWQPYRFGNQYRGAWVYKDGRGVVLIGATDGLMTVAEADALPHRQNPRPGAGTGNYYGSGVNCSCCTTDKGWHAYPYTPTLYAVDPADLARVAAGEMDPWDVQPFAVISSPDWLLQRPEDGTDPRCLGQWFAGMAWDPEAGRLYVAQGQCWPRSNGSYRTGAAVAVLEVR